MAVYIKKVMFITPYYFVILLLIKGRSTIKGILIRK
jgi:hypothetical protein